jgi:hypothetical protein
MATLPAWNYKQFGCIQRDATLRSLMRTVLTASLPLPMFSRKGDTAAPVMLAYTLDVDDAGMAAWEQWYAVDLFDGTLPFTMYLPWGLQQPRVRARLMGNWSATRVDLVRWNITGSMEVERESLPRFSGGALA